MGQSASTKVLLSMGQLPHSPDAFAASDASSPTPPPSGFSLSAALCTGARSIVSDTGFIIRISLWTALLIGTVFLFLLVLGLILVLPHFIVN
jgi:hypothetical protein